MKKINNFVLAALCALGCMMNSSCTNEEVIDNSSVEKPMHHVGLYTLSKDLLEIYDAEVVAVCDGQVLNTIDLKNSDVYEEDAETKSFNVDMHTTASSVEYKLQLSCCKAEDDLDLGRDYELGINAQFVSVEKSPEQMLKMMKNAQKYNPQSLNGMQLASHYMDDSEYGVDYKGKSVYAVYAEVNSKSFVLGAY